MLREKVQWINGVFFTHEHADHTAGIDDLRPFEPDAFVDALLPDLEDTTNAASQA